MISKMLSPGLKLYKTVCGLLCPLLRVVIGCTALLCCFESAEGSNSRMICFFLLLISLSLYIVLKLSNRRLNKANTHYRIYQAKIIRKTDPENMVSLCILLVITVLPFLLLISTSLKNSVEASAFEFSWWPREGVDLNSYLELFTYADATGVSMAQAVLNSFIYSFVPTIAGLFTSAAAAYAFAKLEFKRKNLMYSMLIATMMLPGCITLATSYMLYDWYGWINSALPLIIPRLFGGAGTVMFLREFFMGIPDGLLEAARIDGAGRWKNFYMIMLPLAKPALLAQFILGFIGAYNDYLGPLIYLNDPSKYTIQVAISFLNNTTPDKALLASACVFTLVPMFLLYVIFQKQIISGISISSGLKG